ncbi:hypothetical protein M3P19_02875 [Muricauda sp. 2012CJ35-5]|uniref:Tetratricopeptide repeat protein n=1 Tax=Flagellimonas spongiicola TaxID=2942208 RepID=A0ABT0PQG2_9FLAO|nr:hypothetical protein [Allomuricauda spongiicola]MCL6272932.1 hypothetical protein [Allomuricauda spongiicola]
MKRLLVLAFLSITAATTAQDKYVKGMEKAFQLWRQQQPLEASNLFERIAMAEQDNWIPHYYVAHVNTISSFGERDFEKLSKQLEKAKEFLDLAKAISPDNPELMVLEALINTAWIAYDGATYGMTLSGKNFQLYEQAMAMAPQNPRVVLSKAEWDMGSARYFGKDIAPYCQDIERSLELFANFSNDTPFYPSWGKDRAEQVLEQCKS